MMIASIKIGAFVSQDFWYFHWPEIRSDNPIDPDIEFYCTWNGKFWKCIADGYGSKNNYGSGSIFVFDQDGVIPVV